MLENLVDGALDAIPLELEQGLPNPRVHNLDVLIEQTALLRGSQEILEDVEQGLVVDEFRGVVLVKLVEVTEDLILHVGDQRRVVPTELPLGFQVENTI